MVSSWIFKVLEIQVFDGKVLSNGYNTSQKACPEAGGGG